MKEFSALFPALIIIFHPIIVFADPTKVAIGQSAHISLTTGRSLGRSSSSGSDMVSTSTDNKSGHLINEKAGLPLHLYPRPVRIKIDATDRDRPISGDSSDSFQSARSFESAKSEFGQSISPGSSKSDSDLKSKYFFRQRNVQSPLVTPGRILSQDSSHIPALPRDSSIGTRTGRSTQGPHHGQAKGSKANFKYMSSLTTNQGYNENRIGAAAEVLNRARTPGTASPRELVCSKGMCSIMRK